MARPGLMKLRYSIVHVCVFERAGILLKPNQAFPATSIMCVSELDGHYLLCLLGMFQKAGTPVTLDEAFHASYEVSNAYLKGLEPHYGKQARIKWSLEIIFNM